MQSQNQGNKSFSMLGQVFEDEQKEELSKQLKNMPICQFCNKKLEKTFDQHLMQKHEDIGASDILNKLEERMKIFGVKAKVKKPTPEEKLKYRNIKEEVTRISTGALYDLV